MNAFWNGFEKQAVSYNQARAAVQKKFRTISGTPSQKGYRPMSLTPLGNKARAAMQKEYRTISGTPQGNLK